MAFIAAPPLPWKPSQGSFLPAWETTLLAGEVSITGSGDSERKVEESCLRTAPSEPALPDLSRG